MNHHIRIEKVSIDQLTLLQRTCREVYPIYFGDYWLGTGLTDYLEEQFGDERLQADLTGEAVAYFFPYLNGQLAGFLKVNYEASIQGLSENVAALEKLYLYPDYRGKGVGETAMNQLIDLLRQKGKDLLSLDVIETNTSAISFYKKQGFRYHRTFSLPYSNLKADLNYLQQLYLKIA